MIDILGFVFIIVGLAFDFFGCLGHLLTHGRALLEASG